MLGEPSLILKSLNAKMEILPDLYDECSALKSNYTILFNTIAVFVVPHRQWTLKAFSTMQVFDNIFSLCSAKTQLETSCMKVWELVLLVHGSSRKCDFQGQCKCKYMTINTSTR